METKFRVSSQFIVGLFILFIGVAFLLDNLGYIDSDEILQYWPAFLIVFGAAQLIGGQGRFSGWVFVGFGALLLLGKFHMIRFHFWDIWPLIIIFAGLSLLMRRAPGRRSSFSIFAGSNETSDTSTVQLFALMGGVKRICTSQDFRGGEATAIMGGIELDLRGATIADSPAVLHMFTCMGGVEIKVPQDWVVEVETMPILGGVDDKTTPPTSGASKRLILRGTAFMGGAEIKN
ncbi:MAG TPA: DUF5668 domain-containing protein [Bacteroidota bacterium]|nr:DUF5668 domain-containing protein [Bacteroidota bacterium]